jgi:hypothetical protein
MVRKQCTNVSGPLKRLKGDTTLDITTLRIKCDAVPFQRPMILVNLQVVVVLQIR